MSESHDRRSQAPDGIGAVHYMQPYSAAEDAVIRRHWRMPLIAWYTRLPGRSKQSITNRMSYLRGRDRDATQAPKVSASGIRYVEKQLPPSNAALASEIGVRAVTSISLPYVRILDDSIPRPWMAEAPTRLR